MSYYISGQRFGIVGAGVPGGAQNLGAGKTGVGELS